MAVPFVVELILNQFIDDLFVLVYLYGNTEIIHLISKLFNSVVLIYLLRL